MLDLGHEVQYSKTHEDLLYGSAAFAGVYAAANTFSRLGAPQKLPGVLAAGAHGSTLGSNFLLGMAGNAFNLTNRAAHKMFGNYGWAKQMMTNEGMNLGFLNFRTQSVNAFNAAGGYGSSVLPGINVSLKGQMAKHLDSTADFTAGMVDKVKNANRVLKKDKALGESIHRSLSREGQSLDDLINLTKQSYVQDDIIAASQGAVDDLAKLSKQSIVDDGAKAISSRNAGKKTGKITAKEAAKQYGDEAAEKIVANLSDDALLKYGGKELAGKAIATEAERAALQTAAKTEIGRQVALQARNSAFAKTLAGRGLAGVGAFAGSVGKFLFSAPVQTILAVETGVNLAASARTNNQVKNIKEYQGAKQAYFNNPATQAAIQKGGAIYQNNNNDLNFLLSSPNVATQVANRR